MYQHDFNWLIRRWHTSIHQTGSNTLAREKGRDLTQSYDKSQYTSKMSKGQSENTSNATKSSISQRLADRTKDGRVE